MLTWQSVCSKAESSSHGLLQSRPSPTLLFEPSARLLYAMNIHRVLPAPPPPDEAGSWMPEGATRMSHTSFECRVPPWAHRTWPGDTIQSWGGRWTALQAQQGRSSPTVQVTCRVVCRYSICTIFFTSNNPPASGCMAPGHPASFLCAPGKAFASE